MHRTTVTIHHPEWPEFMRLLKKKKKCEYGCLAGRDSGAEPKSGTTDPLFNLLRLKGQKAETH